MKERERGLYCTVDEAGLVLGMCPEEIRKRMKDGSLNVGEVLGTEKRKIYRIRRDLVAMEAGIDEFPSDLITGPKSVRAKRAGMMLKENGIDASKVADILFETGVIMPYQREKMAGVM